jgi:hypothetical protein
VDSQADSGIKFILNGAGKLQPVGFSMAANGRTIYVELFHVVPKLFAVSASKKAAFLSENFVLSKAAASDGVTLFIFARFGGGGV